MPLPLPPSLPPPRPSTDPAAGDGLERLLKRIADGDHAAFRALHDRTASRLLAVALAVTRNRDAAEEAVQEGFLRIWQRAALFDPSRGGGLPWMATVVRHIAASRRPVRRTIPNAGMEPGIDVLPSLMGAHDLIRSLNRLDQGPRTAILLSVLYGFTHQELAALMKVPVGTTKSWVRRGLHKLRVALDTAHASIES